MEEKIDLINNQKVKHVQHSTAPVKLFKYNLEGKSSKVSESYLINTEHSFITDLADVRHMEQGLLQLLNDFHKGKLQAFGPECSFEKMDKLREQQEKLARMHFDMDSQKENSGIPSKENTLQNMKKLIDNLQELCLNIQDLQKDPLKKN